MSNWQILHIFQLSKASRVCSTVRTVYSGPKLKGRIVLPIGYECEIRVPALFFSIFVCLFLYVQLLLCLKMQVVCVCAAQGDSVQCDSILTRKREREMKKLS